MILDSGATGRAAVPSGASTGAFEAVELRDGDRSRYGGKGVDQAVEHVRRDAGRALLGVDALDQRDIDAAMVELDGTPNKSSAGRERDPRRVAGRRPGRGRGQRAAALPLRRRGRRARAAGADDERHQRRRPRGQQRRPPGVHGRPGRRGHVRRGAADRRRDLPRAEGRCSRSAAWSTAVGDEGGFAPDLASNEEAISAILEAADRAGHRDNVAIAIDAASTEVYADGVYRLAGEGRDAVDRRDDRLPRGAVRPLPDRVDRGRAGRGRLGRLGAADRAAGRPRPAGRRRPVRDQRRPAAARHRAAAPRTRSWSRSTRSARCRRRWTPSSLAHRSGYTAVMSHRSGETEDTTIADLAVATNCGQIKTGAPSRSDRVAKYNQLLRIEEELGAAARYPGRRAFARLAPASAETVSGPAARRTKIVCTIGPASSDPRFVEGLAFAGMDAARLNFSHGGHDDHLQRLQAVRRAQERGRPAAGGDRRPAGAEDQDRRAARPALGEPGRRRRAGGRRARGRRVTSSVTFPGLATVVREGSEVLIDDGLVRLRVLETGDGRVTLPDRGRRHHLVEQGRQPAGHAAADPVADGEGHGGPGVRAGQRRRLRRAVVRPQAGRPPRSAGADRRRRSRTRGSSPRSRRPRRSSTWTRWWRPAMR